MGDFLNGWVDWMSALPPIWVYVSILGIAYLENVLPPVPGDMIIVFGGYLAGLGRVDPVLVIILATIGGAAGFMTMYAIGYRLGHAIMEPDRFRWLPKERIHRVRIRLREWGFGIVAANRFLSGLRSVISLTVGMAHMSPRKTLLYSTLSATIWTVLMTLLGIFVGKNWEMVSKYLRTYGWIVTGAVLAFILFHFVRGRIRRNSRSEETNMDAGN